LVDIEFVKRAFQVLGDAPVLNRTGSHPFDFQHFKWIFYSWRRYTTLVFFQSHNNDVNRRLIQLGITTFNVHC